MKFFVVYRLGMVCIVWSESGLSLLKRKISQKS